MIILPENYAEIYPCVNETGSQARIYVSLDGKKAYKIFRGKFDYDEEKFAQFSQLSNPNCLYPKDVICIDGSNDYRGFMMDFDSGKSLQSLTDVELSKLIAASLEIDPVLQELSQYHFLIADPNVDNIIFSNTYKFVDVDSFLYVKRFPAEKIYFRNLVKVNETVLCGLVGFSYRSSVIHYLKRINSKYVDYFTGLNKQKPIFIHDALSIIQDVTQEETIGKAKTKILQMPRK